MVAATDRTQENLSLNSTIVTQQQQIRNSIESNSTNNTNSNVVTNLNSGNGILLKSYQCWNKKLCCTGNALFLGSALLLSILITFTFLVYYWTINCQTEHIEQLRYNNQSFVNSMGENINKMNQFNAKHNGRNFVNGGKNSVDTDVRLPRSLKPLHYNLTIQPYLQEGNFSFDGRVQIHIKALESCSNITMHSFELNVTEHDIEVRHWSNWSDNRITLKIGKFYFIESKHFLVIELLEKLFANEEYLIDIRFHGLMQNYMQGFYHSSYRNHRNETRWLASTQFQATEARRAFPCFDEPALKAKFILHLARPQNMSAISNMPLVSTENHTTLDNFVWDHFAESVPMSTYLVAYVIADFSHLSDGNFSVWARPEAIQSASFALSVGPKILHFLEDFFDLKFPLAKIDMIALPDFHAGAMENWGLITYRETTMLYEKGFSTIINKQRIIAVIGHELAHQWFGNLVTPSWWSDIWLNEGFASYMEYLAIEEIAPQCKPMDQFITSEVHDVFQLDALSSSHKISVEVGNPEEITSIFDRISYGKGSTIIRMMSHFLTSEVFRRGLSKYLKEMSYSSAEQDDLWRFLTTEANTSQLLPKNISVKDIMDTWTLQIGYPVVSVSNNASQGSTRLKQQRFVFENRSSSTTEEDPLWWIPITYTTAEEIDFENTKPRTWIPRTQIYELQDVKLTISSWHIFNIQQTGYYRVNYEENNWRALTQELQQFSKKSNKFRISVANRAQLIDDSLNLARAGYIAYEIALNLTRYLENEMEYVPWKAAINGFHFLNTMFINQGEYDLLKSYILKLLDNAYKNINGFNSSKWDDDDILEYSRRLEILSAACYFGHRQCIAESIQKFQNWFQSSNPDKDNQISPNLRSVVYCNAIKYGGEDEWNFLYQRYQTSTISSEKDIILHALGCSKEPWILFRYLRAAINGPHHNIRKQDVYKIFATISNSIVGRQIAFDFIRDNWEAITAYLGSSMANFHNVLKYVTKSMNSRFQLAALEWFVKNDLQDESRSIQQVLEHVQGNVNWMNRNYKNIVRWLRREKNNSEEDMI